METFWKVEAHAHTAQVSLCAKMPAEQMVHQVKDAGCDAVIVTDHYTPEFFPDNQRNYAQRLHDYFEGYRCAKAEGDRIGLHVFPALEVLTAAGMEEYLIYGVTPEELERIGCLAHLSLPELREAVHSVPDAILVQAHPYRGYLHCMPAGLLDGVEVCNENPRHNSHNDRALAYAKEHHLLMTAGSDVHELGDAGGAGLLCPAFSDIKAFARRPNALVPKPLTPTEGVQSREPQPEAPLFYPAELRIAMAHPPFRRCAPAPLKGSL